MFFWRVRNIHAFTIGRKTCKSTQKNIFLTFQEYHIDLCKQWVQSPTKREFEVNHTRIEAWWKDSRATIPINIQQRLCWWPKKLTHLAYYPMNELDLKRRLWCQQPILLKMSIQVHVDFYWRWLQFDLTNLYTTIMDAMVKFVLQQQFYHMVLSSNKTST